VKRKKTGFTMVEILTVVGIIALLVAVLVPTLSMVRRVAKETQQKAQLTAIELALTAFKSDYGDYPPSDWQCSPSLRTDYSGAQMLAEALLGWDLLGFHPESEWTSKGESCSGTEIYPDHLDPDDADDLKNLKERRGPYLDVTKANAFRLREWFVKYKVDESFLAADTYVICDVFGTKKVVLSGGKTVRAGTPILYYRANTSKKRLDSSNFNENIYNVYDNQFLIKATIEELIELNKIRAEDRDRTLADTRRFYDYITDPKVTAMKWPYRADSYILISAGADGLYGTEDDICNF